MTESATDRQLETLREENDRLRNLLSLLSDLSLRITSTLDLSTVLQSVVDAACSLTGARYGALGVFDDSGRIQEFMTCGITQEERDRIGDPPKGLGLLGWLNDLQQPIRLADLTDHSSSQGFPPNHPRMKTFLGAPLRHQDQKVGNLYLTEKAGGAEFTLEDETLLTLFAAQAASAIHNSLLYQREHTALARAEQAQQALAESETSLRAILDNSTAVMYIKDNQGRYVLINRRYESLFHTTNDEIKGKTDYDIFPQERADAFWANDQKVLAAGTSLEFEELAPHEDGLHTYISLKVPVRDAGGTPFAVCGISTDITERKRAEEAIRGERQRLQALVDTSPVGVFVAEAKSGRILLVNPEAERILGFSHQPDFLLDSYEQTATFKRPDGSAYAPQDLPIERALTRGETVRAEEVHFEFSDGRSVPTLVNATPIYSDDGQVTGAIAVIQDISPLEEIEKLRNEFLGMVSHELRTPLTAIKGSAATVLGSRRPLEEAETREFFQIIDEQADRLRDMVDNLLDLTRIEAGSLSVNTEPTDLGEALDAARANFLRSGGLQDILLQVPEDLPKVSADRRRLGQVMGNLLSNASKFSPTTAPIEILVEHDPLHVTVRVRDQGRGIPEEKLTYLFKKFSQVHEDRAARMAGSGLGLAICKGIVEAHGGRIWAESPGDGQGTTFSFTLLVSSDPVVSTTPDTTQRAEHLGRVRRAGERTRILAVDDDPRILRLLERSLEEAGYRAIATGDPGQVIGLVEQEQPDLLLMDLILPGTSGFELLRQVREFSGVPVIFVTARDRDEDTVRALRMGADDYITKPFSPSELLARIEAALRRRVLSDQMEARPPFVLGELAINFAQRRVTKAGEPVSLSATEYKLLYELVSHAGMVLTHDQILQRVWGPEYAGEAELVRSFIRNLRRKLGDSARDPRYIFTEPQVGYRIPRPD